MLKPKTKDLLLEVQLLKSTLIGFIGKDKEGDYNPKFVAKLLGDTRDLSKNKFKDKKSFLEIIS